VSPPDHCTNEAGTLSHEIAHSRAAAPTPRLRVPTVAGERCDSKAARLRRLLTDFSVVPYSSDREGELWLAVLEWLARYAEHEPDFADGYLAVVSGLERRSRVWTYDREFRTTWRRIDGTRITLAVN
jgi:hypothetical protein